MEGACPICLNKIEEEKINILSCEHKICEDCIEKFIEFNNKCPICNKIFMKYISKKDNKEHQLTQDNLTNIDKKKERIRIGRKF